MKTTLSVIKADIGSIGGHTRPSAAITQAVENAVREKGRSLVTDVYVGSTGDDIAILLAHHRGTRDDRIHRLAWEAFDAGATLARAQGLYGAGQDLFKDAFAGNVRGLGPASAEIEFEERPNEPFLLFAADKTHAGAYNLPLYLAFTDPMHCPGLLLSPRMGKGFRFQIVDLAFDGGERIVELNAPEELYDIAALLSDNERFAIEAIFSRATGEQAVVVSSRRTQAGAGVHAGQMDPLMLVRVQGAFPASGEILSPFRISHFVGGGLRGSHIGPLMPMRLNSATSFFDGPPMVTCAAFCVHNGKFTVPADAFEHPYWDSVRVRAAQKASDIRDQGFSGPAMLPVGSLEYSGISDRIRALDRRFTVRKEPDPKRRAAS